MATDLTILQLGPKGDGICEGLSGPIFVDRAIPGDKVSIRLQIDSRGIHRGEITELLESSPYRVPAPCPHYESCGNCTLQHLDEQYYRDWKVEVVKEALTKQRLQPQEWKEPIFIGEKKRRRATFAAFKQRDKVVMGYYRRRSKQIADVKSCLVGDPKLLSLRNAVQNYIGPVLRAYTPTDVFLQVVGDSADMLITGPIGRTGVPDSQVVQYLEPLLEITSLCRIAWRESEEAAIKIIASHQPVTATFGGLKVNLPPDAFLQPTVNGERALVDCVLAALPEKGKFADLFSGCGTFSGPMLARGSVDCFESSQEAVSALGKAARGRQLRAVRRDLFRNPLRREEANQYDAIVFDPPRAGSPEQAMALKNAKVPVIVGVSCNPATFARDARILCGGGYRLKSVQIVDQFHWSHHVEMVGVFVR